MAQRHSTWQILLIAVAALASKVVVFAGVAWMPLALDALGIAHAAPAAASFIERLCQWDCGWYAGIMTEGTLKDRLTTLLAK